MKKIFIVSFICILSSFQMAHAVTGNVADWFLYFYSEQYSLNGDVGQFVETEAPGVYLLEGCSVPASGINFCVHNESWSSNYGWKEESVASAGKAVGLASATNASGWLAIAAGTYDITFNSNNFTICFDEHKDEYWYITGDFNNWGLTSKLTRSTLDRNIFTLDNFILTPEKFDQNGGFNLKITTSDWEEMYVCNNSINNLDTEYEFVSSTSEGAWSNAYCSAMTTGKCYKIIWNKNTHKLTISQNRDDIAYATYSDGHALVSVNDYLRGGDISMLNYIEDLGAKFYTSSGIEKDPLDIMKENGVNIVRLRLYNQPGNEVSYTIENNTYNPKIRKQSQWQSQLQ